MALRFTDYPQNTFVSVYEPIKISARLNDSTNKQIYPSILVTITPKNAITDESQVEKAVTIRVPAQPQNPQNIDQASAAYTGTIYYSLDIASICRDFVSFDLRPCNQDTTQNTRRDISQGKFAFNTAVEVDVTIQQEKITNGQLAIDDTIASETTSFHALNGTVSNEEEQASYIDNQLVAGSTADNFQNGTFFRRYLLANSTPREDMLGKYLSLKPLNRRYIGEDECEYLSILGQGDSGNRYPYLQVKFFNLSGNQIGSTNLTLNKISVGDGTYSSTTMQHGVSGVTQETKAMVHFGVGTRNIKETTHGWSNASDGINCVTDFRDISRYEVRAYLSTESTDPQIGETVTYYINHSTTTNIGMTRFHWQNRLGGIDSYTFEDTMIKSLTTSSKTFEQTIYPKFTDQIGRSNNDTFYLPAALEQRTGGVTSDQYHSVSKSRVKAFREGQAISRPISNDEIDMIEDLLSSPRVWTEGGWLGKEVWRDDFSSVPTSADWNVIDGDLGSILKSTSDNHIAGTGSIVYGDNTASNDNELWIHSKKLFPYNPRKIYELEVRVKKEAGDGLTYFGLVGYAADKTTRISTLGADEASSAHYIALSQYDQPNNDEWETYRGYITGYVTSGAGVQSNNINNPAHAYTGIEYFAPQLLVGYNDTDTLSHIDYIKVTEYESDLPNSNGFYSTLNKNYYIPVVIKDGGTTVYDSNNMMKITVNYMHSKEQKTIR